LKIVDANHDATLSLSAVRLHADMAYYGNKLADVDPSGIIGSRLMKQVKELVLLDKKNGQANPAVIPSISTKDSGNAAASTSVNATVATTTTTTTTNNTTTNASATSTAPAPSTAAAPAPPPN
jgi:hypothetical protein